MKIIERLTESELNNIYQNYSYDNITLIEKDRLYWRIPKELALKDNWRSDHNYCSVNNEGRVYTRSHAEKHLREFTGLSTQEFFDLTVLHINDTDDRPKCDNCGKPLGFSNRIFSGYGCTGHAWNETIGHFCSRTCASNYQYNNLDKYEITKSFIESGGTFGKLLTNKPEIFIKSSIDSRRTNFLKFGDPNDPAELYLAETEDNRFKFGATTDIERRVYCSGMLIKYISYKILYKSTRLRVANLEAKLKINLGSNSEYFDKIDLLKFYNLFLELVNSDLDNY